MPIFKSLLNLVLLIYSFSLYSFDSFEHLWMSDRVKLNYFNTGEENYQQYLNDEELEEYPGFPLIKLAREHQDYFSDEWYEQIIRHQPQWVYIASEKDSEDNQKIQKHTFGEIVALAGDFHAASSANPLPVDKNASQTEKLLQKFTISVPNQSMDEIKERFKMVFNNTIRPPVAPPKEEGFFKKIFWGKEKYNEFYRNNTWDKILKKTFTNEFKPIVEHVKEKRSFENLMLAHKNVSGVKSTFKGIWETVAGDYNQVPNYKEILENNVDHFTNDARNAYQAGHELALEIALKVYNENKLEAKNQLLNEAYALEAFASHFLTDLFSSGHMRTPRRDIFNNPDIGTVSHGPLSHIMHDEDGFHGLKVTNKVTNDMWKAYGDSSYFDDLSHENRERIHAALKDGINDIWQTANSGDVSRNSLTHIDYEVSSIRDGHTPFITKITNNYKKRFSYKVLGSRYGPVSYLKGIKDHLGFNPADQVRSFDFKTWKRLFNDKSKSNKNYNYSHTLFFEKLSEVDKNFWKKVNPTIACHVYSKDKLDELKNERVEKERKLFQELQKETKKAAGFFQKKTEWDIALDVIDKEFKEKEKRKEENDIINLYPSEIFGNFLKLDYFAWDLKNRSNRKIDTSKTIFLISEKFYQRIQNVCDKILKTQKGDILKKVRASRYGGVEYPIIYYENDIDEYDGTVNIDWAFKF